MTPKRPQRLVFTGAMLPDGRPERFIEGIPARDMTADETDALTQEQLKLIRDSGLYREVAQPAPKAKPSKSQPEAATDAEADNAGDEPTSAAGTATQGGES